MYSRDYNVDGTTRTVESENYSNSCVEFPNTGSSFAANRYKFGAGIFHYAPKRINGRISAIVDKIIPDY